MKILPSTFLLSYLLGAERTFESSCTDLFLRVELSVCLHFHGFLLVERDELRLVGEADPIASKQNVHNEQVSRGKAVRVCGSLGEGEKKGHAHYPLKYRLVSEHSFAESVSPRGGGRGWSLISESALSLIWHMTPRKVIKCDINGRACFGGQLINGTSPHIDVRTKI